MRVIRMFLCAAACIWIGCAGMSVKSVTKDHEDRGIRYYINSPYLLVHTDNAGALTTSLIYLPDPAKKMSAYPYNFVATNNVTLQFDKGVLKSSEIEADSAAVPKAALAAIEAVAIATIKAGVGAASAEDQKRDEGGPSVPLPVLFKIEVDDTGVHLYGPRSLTPEGGIFVGKDTVKTTKTEDKKPEQKKEKK